MQVIRFEKPAGFTYQPGQFVMVSCDDYKLWGNDLQLKWASFSLSSAPHESTLELCIRVHETPGITNHVGVKKQIGDTVNMKGPWGKFVLGNDFKEIAFVALGTGIAPLISMIRHLLHSNEKRFMHLFYGFRNNTCFVYQNELKELMKKHSNFKVHSIASHDLSQGKQGYVQIVMEHAQFENPKSEIQTYLCGPPKAIDSVIEFMKTQGFKEENLIKEKWE
ncbi:MAG: FAD-dependent oxidoreductase [Candidatus Diapherotrites archaeon]|nr:FAD-dependent oxidoreductase [Candidatus Diapherotrites archaeon]